MFHQSRVRTGGYTEVATWTTSRQRLFALLTDLFRVKGPANLRDEVFPCAHRLGRGPWLGQEREVLFCGNLNGAAPTAFLLARKAQRQPTLVLAHARTRFTSPDVETHFGAGDVVVVFLEDELELVSGQVQRRQVLMVREPVATYAAPAFCVLVDPDGAREIDETTYREVLAGAEDLDLFLDLTRTVRAGRHPTGRREDGVLIEGSVTPQQGAAYAELMERQQAARAAEVRALNGVNHPEKLIEGRAPRARREGQPLRLAHHAAAPRRHAGGQALLVPTARGAALGAAAAPGQVELRISRRSPRASPVVRPRSRPPGLSTCRFDEPTRPARRASLR
jgi:hypothetical protein